MNKEGYYFEPTILANILPGTTAYEEEIFGPVCHICPFDSEEEAVVLANNTATEGGLWFKTNNVGASGVGIVLFDTKVSYLLEGVGLDVSGSNTTYHRLMIQRTDLGTKQRVLVDGVEKSTRAMSKAVDVSYAGVNVVLGDTDAAKVPYHGLKGDVGEIAAYHGILSSQQLADLDGYLKSKWGL